MQRLCSVPDLAEANLIKSLLASEGIETAIHGEHIAGLQGAVPFSPATSPEVWVVDDSRYQDAAELLRAHRDEHHGEPQRWRCKACGELVEGQFSACWNCGAERDDDGPDSDNNRQAGAEAVEPASTPKVPDKHGPARPESRRSVPVRSDRELWVETVVVLGIAVVPYLFISLQYWLWPDTIWRPSFIADHSWLAVNSASISGAVLYIIYRSEASWSSFGLTSLQWDIDLPAALGIWFAVWVVALALSPVSGADPSLFSRLSGFAEHVLLIVAMSLNGFSEELVMRGYLVVRFEHLLRSTWKSVLLTALLFASYHLYQGAFAAGSIFVTGLLYGTAFAWLRRLWPVAIAHAVYDIVVGL